MVPLEPWRYQKTNIASQIVINDLPYGLDTIDNCIEVWCCILAIRYGKVSFKTSLSTGTPSTNMI